MSSLSNSMDTAGGTGQPGGPRAAAPPESAALANADAIVVRHLLVRNIIGVDNWERKKKQDIVINLRLYFDVTAAGTRTHARTHSQALHACIRSLTLPARAPRPSQARPTTSVGRSTMRR